MNPWILIPGRKLIPGSGSLFKKDSKLCSNYGPWPDALTIRIILMELLW